MQLTEPPTLSDNPGTPVDDGSKYVERQGVDFAEVRQDSRLFDGQALGVMPRSFRPMPSTTEQARRWISARSP